MNALKIALSLTCAATAQAQLAFAALPVPPSPAAGVATPYTIVERGPHHRRWQNVVATLDPSGRAIYRTNSYVELETGMHTRDAAGHWIDAGDQIDPRPDGGAVSRNARHRLYFPGNLYADALQCATADGKLLVSRPLGLSYFDGVTNVLVARLRAGPVGQLLPTGNQVLYTNICAGARLDLLVRNKKAGYESDLVIREQLPDPSLFGLVPANVRVQWWTEFFDPPPPVKGPLPNGGIDESLDFGELKMARGKAWLRGEAWLEGADAPRRELPVTKRWLTLGGRTFLVEEMPWQMLAAQLTALQARREPVMAVGSQRVAEAKAVEDNRTPKPSDFHAGIGQRASVMECGSPVPLWFGPAFVTSETADDRASVLPSEGRAALLRKAYGGQARRESVMGVGSQQLAEAKAVEDNLTPKPSDYHADIGQRASVLPSPMPLWFGPAFVSQTVTDERASVMPIPLDLPPQRPFQRSPTPLLIAHNDAQGKTPGFILDYDLYQAQTNFTFQSDTTYYVTNTVTIHGCVLEGGAVIKLGPDPEARINVLDNIVCQTGPFRPVTITGKDDDSIGAPIAGSSGMPAGYYGSGLELQLPGAALSYVRVHFANTGLKLDGGVCCHTFDLDNVELSHCGVALTTTDGETLRLLNALVYETGTFLADGNGALVRAEHVTLDRCDWLNQAKDAEFYFTNSLLVGVTNLSTQTWVFSPNYTPQLPGGAGANTFQTVGAGAHYLVTNSPYRNAGTTNLNPTLAKNLKQKTTWPPLVFYNQILTNNLALSPQAERDLDQPDLGYHYDPLDYTIGHVWLQNAAMTVAPGTVIGTFVNAPGYYGLTFASGAAFTCQGAPNLFNRIVRASLVQERANTNWANIGESLSGPWAGGGVMPQAVFRFTDFAVAAQETYHFRSYFWDPPKISFTDCEFHGGQMLVQGALAATNNLFERVGVSLNGADLAFDLQFRNNLFFGGKLDFLQEVGGNWTFKDNLFDHTTLVQNSVPLDHGYNGYLPGSGQLAPTNINDVIGWYYAGHSEHNI